MFSPCWQLPWALCTPAQEPRVGPFKLQHVPLVKKYLKFTIISIICLWNFWNRLIFKKVISLWAPIRQHLGVPVGAQVCPICVPKDSQQVPLVKNYSKFTISVICLWNFWNRPRFKKVSSLWAPFRQPLGVLVGAQVCPMWVLKDSQGYPTGPIGQKLFKIYYICYLPLKFLKSPKIQES